MKIKQRTFIERRFNLMRNELQKWIAGYRDIQRFIAPTRGFFFDTVPNAGRTIDHKTQLDGGPQRALRTLAAGMTSGLTSPARPWFKIGLQNKDLMEIDPIKIWIGVVEDRIRSIFSKSNIYGAFNNTYEELGAFATASMFIAEDFDTVIRARTFTAGEYFIGTDPHGRVNSFGRLFWMTIGQLVEEYGEDNVTPQVLNQYQQGIVDPWIRVAHLIEPNDDRIPDRSDFLNKPFRSVTWEWGSPTEMALRISGYEEFPVLVPRWDLTTTAFLYGFGPGHYSLGDVKMLMRQKKDYLVALNKSIDPPVVLGPNVQGEANMLPGGVTRSSATTDGAAKPAYQINPNLEAIKEGIQATKADIDSTFYKDLFLMLEGLDAGKMTAYEVSKRYEEKLLQLGPVIERLEGDLFDPLIERTFKIGLRTGVIPPPPPEAQGQELKVEYISVLAQAQKLVGGTAIEQVLSFVGSLAGADPSALDNINFDEAIREYADLHGLPAKILNSAEVVASIRKAQAQRQAQAEAQQRTMALAEGAKTLSQTKVGSGNALEALTGVQPAQGAAA